MIKRPTVFILGAGASCAYGFPSGRKLIFEIADWVKKKQTAGHVRGKRAWLGFEFESLSRFAEELVASELPSVDLFLENRPEYEDVGKALIAAALIPFEGPLRLQRSSEESQWLEYLFSHMASRASAFLENRVSFITFNYDRSVEHFFFTALANSFGFGGAQLEELVSAVPVVHVHGLLGRYGTGDGARSFSPEATESSVRTAAEGIKVIHELDDGLSPEYRLAHEVLRQADVVFFLGFGYHSDNVKRLRAGTMKSYGILAGTGYGLGAAEREKAAQLVGGGIEIAPPDCECLGFLRGQPLA